MLFESLHKEGPSKSNNYCDNLENELKGKRFVLEESSRMNDKLQVSLQEVIDYFLKGFCLME